MQSHHELVVEPIGLDLTNMPKPLHFPTLFGNDHSVELEIGFGKGTFLTETAKAHPEINYYGVEYARWYWRYTSDRLRRNQCNNSRTSRAEAMFFVREYCADASLDVVHIYFPDPWPKKRHNKRRLIQQPFVDQLLRILKPGGRVQIVTDHQDYFEQIEPLIKSSMMVVDYNRPEGLGAGEFVGTNFERKYARQGRPFYALAARKPA